MDLCHLVSCCLHEFAAAFARLTVFAFLAAALLLAVVASFRFLISSSTSKAVRCEECQSSSPSPSQQHRTYSTRNEMNRISQSQGLVPYIVRYIRQLWQCINQRLEMLQRLNPPVTLLAFRAKLFELKVLQPRAALSEERRGQGQSLVVLPAQSASLAVPVPEGTHAQTCEVNLVVLADAADEAHGLEESGEGEMAGAVDERGSLDTEGFADAEDAAWFVGLLDVPDCKFWFDELVL